MPKVSWSPDVKGRVRRLLAELLSYVSDERDDLKLCCKWEDEDDGKPKLVVDTQRRVLVKLAQFETNSQFYEAKNRLEDLKIYEERRIHTRGSENWRFALRLWSKDKATNLIKFDQAWENQRPEKSKRLSSRKAAPQKIQDSSSTPCDKIPSNIPRSGVVDFVGRTQELEELHEKLHSYNRVAIVAIAGMGGVGKTELAVRYSQQHLELRTYQGGICWLHPKRGDISVQIVEFAIAHFQNFTLPNGLTPVGQVEFCWQHWAEGQVLVVLDDVVDYRQVEDYLPPESLPRFKVLFTTREKLGTPLVRLDLNVLKPRAALDLLKSLIDKERLKKEPWIARKLCNRLGCLPLGLELVGRYLAQDDNLSLAEMLRRLERKRLRHKALESVESTMRARLGVADAFELSWERLDEAAQRLGCFMSLYALAPIPWNPKPIESLVSEEDLKIIKKQIEALQISQEDLDAFEELIEATEVAKNQLVRLSLIEPVAEGFYRFHQLIRDFFQEKLEALPDANNLKRFFATWIATLVRQFPKPLTSKEIAAISPLIPHIGEVARQMSKLLTNEDFRFPFEALVYFYERQGLYYYAGDWCERYLAEVEARFGEEHIATATIQRILAFLYKQQGQFTKAESLYEKALDFLKQNLGEQHPFVATTQNKLALVYCLQGRFQESESLFNQSLVNKQLTLDDDDDLGDSFNDIAILYLQQGRYREAERLLLKALELSENSKDKDTSGYATVLNNLGTLYKALGRYNEAESKFTQSSDLTKELLGEHHPNFAGFQNNLASVYKLQGRYQKAESLYLKSLKILNHSLGKEHPDVISTLNNLGNLYSEQKEYSKAEPFFVQALETRKHSLGENHPDYATSLNDLGLLYTGQGHYSKAKPLLLQAVEIRKRVLGESHPDYATNLNNLAILYLYQGHFDEVESMYRKALAVRQSSLGDNHPDVAASLHNLADFYTIQGDYDEAQLYWKQALDIANQVLGAEHPDTQLYSGCLQELPMLRDLPRALVKDILQKANPKSFQLKNKRAKNFLNEYRYLDTRQSAKKQPKGFMIENREDRDILENPDFFSHLVPVAKKIFYQLGLWIKKQAVKGYQQIGKGIVLVEIQNSYDEIKMSYLKQASCIKASENAPSEMWDSVLMYLDIYNPKDYFIVLIVDQLENPGTNTCHHYMLPL